jgi:hypothetical protein
MLARVFRWAGKRSHRSLGAVFNDCCSAAGDGAGQQLILLLFHLGILIYNILTNCKDIK